MLTILTSSLMILVFTAFNVGVPIVSYLCPMMSVDNPHCEMIPPATQSVLSFTSEIPDCCTSRIIAERNTTPYINENVKSHLTLHSFLVYTIDNSFATTSFQISDTPHNSGIPIDNTSPPLHILNSTLLI